ncbi:hypothetical protein OG788_45940 [Streptomyces sp. NBC_00647]|uniref:hypothetical protein n=1 Tax=Streptomyces sp. NBC_00647 TaxID=2975796 RepID=UPI003254FAAC
MNAPLGMRPSSCYAFHAAPMANRRMTRPCFLSTEMPPALVAQARRQARLDHSADGLGR